MPWPHPAVPSPTLALAGWCPLSPTGAQTTQLLVEPPWRPSVLWDRVTLTCQGSGTTGVTTWYKDRWRWRQEAHNRLTVPERGNYTCERPGTGLTPVRVLDAPLVLQVPAQAPLEGDTVTLRCRRWRDNPVNSVSFYHEEKKLQELRDGTELSLSPLQLQHSGRYSLPVANVTITLSPLSHQVHAGDPMTLRCSVQWPQGSVGPFCSCSCS
ncbi:LOW QUALITY PROTEIN: low affinity immunoglobulin gamma Fc region receptor II-like [Passerculus sandwichensis]